MIISKSLDGIITNWNKSPQRLFGYRAEETIGKPITLLIPLDRLPEEPEIIARLKRGERVEHFETIRRRKDGSLVDISLTISPIRDGNGKIIGASKVARDITESKKMTVELQQANAVLEQFAYSASHDLQEPLRTVKIYGQILLRKYGDQLDAEGISVLRFMQDGATRMEALLRDLLAYTMSQNSKSRSKRSMPTSLLSVCCKPLAAVFRRIMPKSYVWAPYRRCGFISRICNSYFRTLLETR